MCNGPDNMKHKLMLTTPASWFQCGEGYDASQVLSKCDACKKSPCGANGECVSLGYETFKCRCNLGFYGDRCDSQVDACFGDPCRNGGQCSAFNGRFECNCQAGFSGRTCEVNVNDCEMHQCKNGATCVDKVQDYECRCPFGYRGRYCETSLDLCEELKPCKNGASCSPVMQDYQCECPLGFTDKNCSTNIDDCLGNVCQNDAHCIDGLGEYTCECSLGYTGKYCATKSQSVPQYLRSSVCQNSDCQNGGVCFQPPGSDEYLCRCPAGYEGKKCEKLPSVTFLKDAYVQSPGLDFKQIINITMTFSTSTDNGILFHQGDETHIAAELYQGRVRVSFGPEDTLFSGLLLYSYVAVNNSRPHTLSIIVNGRNVTMSLDGSAPRYIYSTGSQDYVRSKTNLYFGGLPERQRQLANSKFHVIRPSSFSGCFMSVYVNNRRFDFSDVNLVSSQVIPGCDQENLPDPCDNNICVNGRCVPDFQKMDYSCQCSRGFTGSVCDESVVSCNAVRYKDYYTDPETGCMSKGIVKLKRCEGDEFCTARKMRPRTVKFQCDDNRTYKKDIEIPRKCSRSKRKRLKKRL